ncbi:hemerythrin domain-containing protein [Microbispora hainanensis]|uniref:Hemerythrin domain-containing protein n=1 Tax=Microbispora hainanensis TaxID=568844 RepID=A0A544YWV8_9ACTN|nr:hemerythrin domain-containing protein [Microbispora hainanensis]TQS21022.1 hemerythrin domain-containing protein [Microbispora hainanensis]
MADDLQRALAVGNELIAIHARFRDQLATLRAQAAGHPPQLDMDLKTHCLTFCEALHEHHQGEDHIGFPLLEQHFPTLRPVLEKLRDEHVVVARIYHDLTEALRREDLRQLRADLDRLTAELESHFDYEEEQLVAALNQLPGPA